ncbi:hypothetical protein [Devosia sp.]|uniref:hypothetical protein n=1 Tax=Devosia sp. TaxID=1871048 RepID=UPI003266A6C1
MNWKFQSRKRLAAVAAACLISVALPAIPATAAKIKDKGASGGMAQPAAPAAPMEYKIDIPTIEAIGANVSDAVLREIASGNIAGHAEELAKLEATSITIPSVTMTFSAPGADGAVVSSEVTYHDLVLDKVVGGVATSTSIGGADVSSSTGEFKASFGKMSTGTLDIGGTLGIYGLVPAAADAGFKPIYTDLAMAGGTLSATNVDCKIGAISVASFEARPLKTSFSEMMKIASDMEAQKGSPSPESMGKVFKMYADFLTAFKSSPMDFGGIDCSGKTDDGQPMTIALGGMTMSGFEPGHYPEISLNDIKADVGTDGKFSLANFTSKTFDLTSVIAAIEAAPAAVDEAWLTANARSLIPSYAGLSFKDFAVDAPNPDTPSERVKATIAGFDLSLAKYLNGIPTAITSSASNVVIGIPTDTTDEQMKTLIDLGVTKLDLGFGLDLAWDEATQSIAINDLSLTGADLATVKLAGGLGNVPTALFSISNDEAMGAAMGIVVKTLNLDVLDAGLSDLILKRASADQGMDPATMRTVFSSLAEGTIISYLAGAAEGGNVGKAVSKFVSGTAKSLNINLVAKDEPGLGLMDFMAAESDPTQLIGKVNITATAK